MALPLKLPVCAVRSALMSRVTPALDTTDHSCPLGSATVEMLVGVPAGLCQMPCSAEVAAFVGGVGVVGSGVGFGFGSGVGVVGSGDGVGRLGSEPPPPLPQPPNVKTSRVAAVSASVMWERRALVFRDVFMLFTGKNV